MAPVPYEEYIEITFWNICRSKIVVRDLLDEPEERSPFVIGVWLEIAHLIEKND